LFADIGDEFDTDRRPCPGAEIAFDGKPFVRGDVLFPNDGFASILRNHRESVEDTVAQVTTVLLADHGSESGGRRLGQDHRLV